MTSTLVDALRAEYDRLAQEVEATRYNFPATAEGKLSLLRTMRSLLEVQAQLLVYSDASPLRMQREREQVAVDARIELVSHAVKLPWSERDVTVSRTALPPIASLTAVSSVSRMVACSDLGIDFTLELVLQPSQPLNEALIADFAEAVSRIPFVLTYIAGEGKLSKECKPLSYLSSASESRAPGLSQGAMFDTESLVITDSTASKSLGSEPAHHSGSFGASGSSGGRFGRHVWRFTFPFVSLDCPPAPHSVHLLHVSQAPTRFGSIEGLSIPVLVIEPPRVTASCVSADGSLVGPEVPPIHYGSGQGGGVGGGSGGGGGSIISSPVSSTGKCLLLDDDGTLRVVVNIDSDDIIYDVEVAVRKQVQGTGSLSIYSREFVASELARYLHAPRRGNAECDGTTAPSASSSTKTAVVTQIDNARRADDDVDKAAKKSKTGCESPMVDLLRLHTTHWEVPVSVAIGHNTSRQSRTVSATTERSSAGLAEHGGGGGDEEGNGKVVSSPAVEGDDQSSIEGHRGRLQQLGVLQVEVRLMSLPYQLFRDCFPIFTRLTTDATTSRSLAETKEHGTPPATADSPPLPPTPSRVVEDNVACLTELPVSLPTMSPTRLRNPLALVAVTSFAICRYGILLSFADVDGVRHTGIGFSPFSVLGQYASVTVTGLAPLLNDRRSDEVILSTRDWRIRSAAEADAVLLYDRATGACFHLRWNGPISQDAVTLFEATVELVADAYYVPQLADVSKLRVRRQVNVAALHAIVTLTTHGGLLLTSAQPEHETVVLLEQCARVTLWPVTSCTDRTLLAVALRENETGASLANILVYCVEERRVVYQFPLTRAGAHEAMTQPQESPSPPPPPPQQPPPSQPGMSKEDLKDMIVLGDDTVQDGRSDALLLWTRWQVELLRCGAGWSHCTVLRLRPPFMTGPTLSPSPSTGVEVKAEQDTTPLATPPAETAEHASGPSLAVLAACAATSPTTRRHLIALLLLSNGVIYGVLRADATEEGDGVVAEAAGESLGELARLRVDKGDCGYVLMKVGVVFNAIFATPQVRGVTMHYVANTHHGVPEVAGILYLYGIRVDSNEFVNDAIVLTLD